MASESNTLSIPESKRDFVPPLLTRSLSTLPIHFSKRIRDLENEISIMKVEQVISTQHRALETKDVAYAKLKIKADEQDLYIKTLSNELSRFGEGGHLLDKVNQLTFQLENCELEKKKLYEQLNVTTESESVEYASTDCFRNKYLESAVKDLRAELEIKEGDLRRAQERLHGLKKGRNEVVEYTVTLESTISKLEQDKEALIQIIVERDKTIYKLESDLNLSEQSSKDEQEFFFQQLARKTNALTSEIKELETKLRVQSIEKDETVIALNTQLQMLNNKYAQLKKENLSIKEKNESLNDISLNFNQKLLEVQDQLCSKFAQTQEDLIAKIQNLMRENADLELKLSEFSHTEGYRASIIDAQSFEDEMKKLEELRQSWTHVQTYNEMLSAKYELQKTVLSNKEIKIRQLEQDNNEKIQYLTQVIQESVRDI